LVLGSFLALTPQQSGNRALALMDPKPSPGALKDFLENVTNSETICKGTNVIHHLDLRARW